ncbi:MAG: hypothetical protein KJ630_13655 [Proteobacteria bacterium]|nr:hypothetical protein [Pseudomonadota bacterium]
MAEKAVVDDEIEAFIASWPGDYQPMRDCFRLFCQQSLIMVGVTLSLSARPGVSYSLRFHHSKMAGREFFAIIDVIDDDPDSRWLSVCFQKDLISDPEDRGECIPGGLPGSDGYCFDLNDDDREFTGYLVARLHEAHAALAV